MPETVDFSTRDFFKYTSQGVSGNITRGLVVDINDPLQSGRVKVWIPLLHGGMLQNDPANPYNLNESGKTTNRLGDITNPDSVACLPWAPVLGHNWASTSDLNNGATISNFGVFNIPKIGTEVIVTFEDDDPNYPIVLGSVFHETDLAQSVRKTPLFEITPGTPITPTVDLTYDSVVQSYQIQSEKGYSLLLSDVEGQEEIFLGGAIPLTQQAVTTEFGNIYQAFSSAYPNFPTTQSAPFRVRNSTINTTNPIINIDLLHPSATTTTLTSTVQNANLNNTPAPLDTTPNITITKQLPIPTNISWNAPSLQQGQTFGCTRANGEWHDGIDLTFNTSTRTTTLVAPIDGTVVYVKLGSSTAGNYIIYQGADNYYHTFMHLSSVSGIQGNKYSVGSTLGITGGAVGAAGSGGHTTGAHLHWEVFTSASPTQAITDRTTSQHNHSIFIDPLKQWLGNKVQGTNIKTTVNVGANQIDSFTQAWTIANNYNYDKPIGIEMSLDPGAEQVFLRHPSGAYLGFDPDGNFKLYTPGSAEFKINRNLVFDVLGGIFNSCMAVYTRARQVIKSFAGTGFTNQAISAFTDFPVNTDKNVFKKYNIPRIFQRIDDNRKNDMNDALKQSTSNIYYNLAGGTLGKSLSQITKNGYAADVAQDAINQIKFPFSTYDDLINQGWKNYIQPNKNEIASRITPKILKAILLLACKGNPNPPSINGRVGVYQISPVVAKYIKDDSAQLASYTSPANNIDIAIQFINTRANSLYSLLTKSNSNLIWSDTDPLTGAAGSKEYAMRAVLMDYIYCIETNTISNDIENLYNSIVIGGGYGYPALESSFYYSHYANTNTIIKNDVLSYGATIIAITQNSQFSI